jgi:hypothetical protein
VEDSAKVMEKYQDLANSVIEAESGGGKLKDDKTFLTTFETSEGELFDQLDSTWKHLTFIRMVWLYLTTTGRREGVAKIMEGTKKFYTLRKHANSVFHMTLVYFWLQVGLIDILFRSKSQQIVDYCLKLSASSSKAEEENKNEAKDTNAFQNFVKAYPFLLNDELFLQYYKVSTIFHHPPSMEQFVLPDIKQLPSIVQTKSKVQ